MNGGYSDLLKRNAKRWQIRENSNTIKARNRFTWITSLSLDASTVAVIWQHSISVQHSLAIDWHHRVLLFLSVWLGYSADRWLDAWRHNKNVSLRHSFHAVRRWSMLSLWLVILGISIYISVTRLNPFDLRNGIYLAFASIIITCMIQLDQFNRFRMVIKSALTAALVTTSVLIFAIPSSIRSTIEAVIIMTSLFYLNCILIHFWDRFIDAQQEKEKKLLSPKHTVVLATITAFGTTIPLLNANPLAGYAFISVVLLLVIHRIRDQLHDETRRTLADIALLTPVLAFF